jgi:transcription initiation factor TFIIIB Brf1 subunit/transcription initiation factor TFIIB
MLNEGKTIAEIQLRYKRYTPSVSQINGIKYGRTKLVTEPRADAYASLVDTDEPVRTGKTVTELLDNELLTALEDMGTRTGIMPGDRAAMLEKLSRVDRHIKSSRLESALGRRDAAVIAELIRMYQPAATDEEVVQIYRKAVELAKLKERDG